MTSGSERRASGDIDEDLDTANDAADDDAPRYSGRWAILAVAAMALLMASYAWWHHRQSGRRALAFWTPATSLLISRSASVDIFELGPLPTENSAGADPAADRFGNLPLVARRTKLIERAASVPGLGKACTILLQDNAFAWDEPIDACQPVWQYAIEFRDADRAATVLISLSCPRVKLLNRDATVSIRPIAEPLREFLVSQFPATVPAEKTPAKADANSRHLERGDSS
jgi:hypothetical protein